MDENTSIPLIILGAGASHDSNSNAYDIDVSHRLSNFKPPMTNTLFDRSKWNGYIEKNLKEISELATHANNQISRGISLEEYLTDLQNTKSKSNNKRLKQLLALRYYLSNLFQAISDSFHENGNNYQSLITDLEDYYGGKALVVNFNYDLLFEKNIANLSNTDSVEEYIKGDIKVIKIHGACDWIYKPEKNDFNTSGSTYIESDIYYVNNAEKFVNKELELNRKTAKSINYKLTQARGDSVYYYLPALAIPVAGKHSHICPSSHIDILNEYLVGKVDRILVIGWRANDKLLLDIINKVELSKPTPVYIVSKDENSATEISKKFTNPKFKVHVCKSKGFSEFVKNNELTEFLNRSYTF